MSHVRRLLNSPLLAVALLGVAGFLVFHPPFAGHYSIYRIATGQTPGMEGPGTSNLWYNWEPEDQLHTPPGFVVHRYAGKLRGIRLLRFADNGDLLATVLGAGLVVRIPADRDHDGKPDGSPEPLLRRLDHPHGIDIHQGWLYIAEGGAVFRAPLDQPMGGPVRLKGPPEYLVRGLPRGGGHHTRTVKIGPDGHMYVSIGSTCNVCIERDPRRATIMRFDLDGKNGRVYASGLRNSVGLAFQPGTGKLYATDNGRDLLGDDFPPCELNLIEDGGFYGWPFANGDRVPDPNFGAGHEAQIAASRLPAHDFRAHNAPLGITFYTGTAFPARYQGAAFVGLHGSWNRTHKDGYKVVALLFGPDGIHEEDFLTGFLSDDERTFGRPVDAAVGPDGALYVSDDATGQVYRVAYEPGSKGSP